MPLKLKQTFELEAFCHNYKDLRRTYTESQSITRSKGIILPQSKLKVNAKNSEIVALKSYITLPANLKELFFN